jgi:transposase
MEVVYTHCCGLDVHKRVVVACLVTPGPAGGEPVKQVRSFGTMTAELEQLAAWLAERGCTVVAMESTGVYWQPIWNVLEASGRFELLLVNARHVKAVPGRKTDVKDSEWLAELLRHGLLRGSFIPDREQRELRELTRYRTALVQERVDHVNRLQKTLEGANIKLASVASSVVGVSARQMLTALIAGDASPAELAELARGRLRAELPALERALSGSFRAHHRFLVARLLETIDFLDEQLTELDREIEARQRPFAEVVQRLDAIPGVGRRTAEVLVSELGTDLSRFPSAGHLASWAGLCPGQDESAGKRRSGRTRKGNRALRTALVEAGQAAGRTKQSYLGAQYRRLARRRGKQKATVAVAHSILVIAYHLLTSPEPYRDLGPDYFDRADPAAEEQRLVRRVRQLGYTVTKPADAA